MSVSAETLTVVPCAGVPITACTPTLAVGEVIRLATSKLDGGLDIHLCNAYTLALADKDAAFKAMLQGAAINFPDGKSVVWANKLLHRGRDIANERVYGPDLFLDVFEQGQEQDLRHYLLGSTPEVLQRLEAEFRLRYPRAAIVGVDSPPFRPLGTEERAAIGRRLMASGAQVVWVGLGTPKQDWEAARLAAEVTAVFIAVGAAFDFVAGSSRQAPSWMRQHGLEWLFRLLSEPRRLWRRYLCGNIRFVVAVARGAKRSRSKV